MKIKLETLDHQTDALAAIDKAFPGMDQTGTDPNANYIYANPLVNYRYKDKANIDVKMETGTGKTYVYTRLMYELHRKYGLFKFVIAVPSPGIKEGTRSFITSDYARQHFSQFYPNTQVQLNVINAGDFSGKSGRRNFPAQLSEFVEATRQNANQIQILLINSGMLHSKSMKRDDYDQTLLGGETSPIKAIKSTRPIVIIDEPHRFPRGKKYYADIEALKPQLIFRFGATFPEITTGRGKNKVTRTDYYRGKPQFNLNAVDSFNQGLVKGIDINCPDISREEAANRYRVKSVKSKELVLTKSGKEYSLTTGENLADIDSGFAGNVTYVGGTDHELSNGLVLQKDMELIPGTFAESYQDEIISEALDRHFEIEQENFMRENAEENAPRIKTLSLFFIDSISSFRGSDRTRGWLANHFERMLTEKLNDLIDKYELTANPREEEYCQFLKATLQSLKSEHQDVYAGYFSEDRGSSDEDIQAEVDDILRNKEKLLSFKDEQGNWVTRRFLFSKWTLREGWDNPNVFVIAKLRTSGSDISKIQEVGRGLRLPVDETGHRLNQDEWPSRLAFLIGYDEQDFAEKLVGEINDDVDIEISHEKLTSSMLDIVIETHKKKYPEKAREEIHDEILDHLGNLGIISASGKFLDEVEIDGRKQSGYEAFMSLYPEVGQKSSVASGRVRDLKKNRTSTKVKLRKSNWNQLKELWIQLSKRQMIKYDDSVNQDAETVARDVFKDADRKIFVLDIKQVVRKEISVDAVNGACVRETKSDYDHHYRTMPYGKFLKQLTIQTDLPVNLLNDLMIQAMREHLGNRKEYINEKTLSNLISTFNRQFNDRIRTSYSYVPLEFSGSTSIYNAGKQDFVDEVDANVLGVYSAESTADDKYLYDRPPLRYDSTDPELRILQRTYGDKITVFGKLPKRAIKIPRYDSGTTTPDFIFKIDREDRPVYVIIETKAENMRLGDEEIRTIQETYFDQLKASGVYYRMATSEDEVHQLINKIENGEIEPDDITD